MTIIKTATNTQLKTMPFEPESGFAKYQGIIDHVGHTTENSMFGDLSANSRRRDLSLSFQVGHYLDQVIVTENGGGLISDVDSQTHATCITAGDFARMRSLRRVDFQTGFETVAVFDAVFTDYRGAATVRQEIGLAGTQNGFLFYVEAGEIGIIERKDSTDTLRILQRDFNMDKADGTGLSGFKLDITKLNTYRVQFGYMGNMPVIFEIYGGHQNGWIPIHVIDKTNSAETTSIQNQYLPMEMLTEVLAGVPEVPIILSTSSWYIGSLAGEKTATSFVQFAAKNAVTFAASGGVRPILGLEVLSTFRGQVSLVPINFQNFAFASTGSRHVEFELYGGIIATDAIWENVDVDNSVVRVAKNDFSYTGGRYLGSLFVASNGAGYLNLAIDEVRIERGQQMAIIANTNKAAEIGMSLRWGEIR